MQKRLQSVHVLGAAFAILAVLPIAARADTAVVPTDFATIQAAVNAVQGTADALVRIDSNGIFVETVIATQSVAIQGGTGFSPTIQGATTNCGPTFGSCAVLFNPNSATPTSFALRDLRLFPRNPANSGDRVIETLNQGAAESTVVVERIVIDDPADSGAHGVHIRKGDGAGEMTIAITDSSITLRGAPGAGTEAIVLAEGGTLNVDGLTLTMSESSATAFSIGSAMHDSTFSLTNSTVTLDAPTGSYDAELGIFAWHTEATIARNTFHLHSNAEGFASGFRVGSAPNAPPATVRLDGNVFIGTGPKVGQPIAVIPFSNETDTLVATNNVVRGMRHGFVFGPNPGANPGDPAAVVVATLTNNTIDGSGEGGILLDLREGTSTTLNAANNLMTNGAGCGIELTVEGAPTTAITADYDGFFGNAGGDRCGIGAGAHDVVGDPVYVDVAGGDLRLGPGSPMIDHGTNAAPELPSTDAGGAPRVQNGTADIGAFEAGPSVTTTSSPGTTTTTTMPALLAGDRLVLTDNATQPAKRKLIVLVKGADVDLGAGPSSADDPVEHGGRLRVWIDGAPAGDYELTGWAYRSARHPEKGYRLRGAGPITRALVVGRKLLKVAGMGLALEHRIGDTAPGPVAVELSLGSRSYCLEFGGREKFKPGRRLVRTHGARATTCGPPA